MIEVELPDGVIAEFPDGMGQDDIKTVLRKKFPAPEQPPAAPLDFTTFQRDEASPFSGIQTSSEELAAANFQRDMEIRKTFPGYDGMRGVPFDPQEGILSGLTGLTPESVPAGFETVESPAFQAARPVMGIPGMLVPKTTATIASSVAKTGIGIADYLSSPQGITELVTSMTPARLLVFGKWAVDMAKGAGEQYGELKTLVEKPDKTPEDLQAISDASVNTVAMIVGAAGMGSKVRTGIKKLAKDLNMPEGKFTVEDRGEVLRQMEERYNLSRQLEAGSPFVRAEAPAEQISMGFRTQPQLSETYGPFQPTFEPSGLRTIPELQPGARGFAIPPEVGAIQPPAPPLAPGPRPVTATRAIRLQGEATQRLADWEKAMAEKVAQEQKAPAHPEKPLTDNQLRIIRDSLEKQILEGQIPGQRRGLIADGPLEVWADQVIGEVGPQAFHAGIPFDARLMAAGIVNGAALLERGITDLAQWTAAMIREYGEGIRPFLNQIRTEAEQVRSRTLKGGEKDALQQETETAVRPVREPEVTPEGAREVPAAPRGEKAAEALKPPPGDRFVELVSEDGTAEIVAFGDKYYDMGAMGKFPSIARWTGKGWSHGAATKGQTIREISKPSEPSAEPTVERVTPLDPQSGSPLSATDALINKMEALKFPEPPPETFFRTGLHSGFNLPHPEILRVVGRDAWNRTVDVAIKSLKAGKALAEAIDDGIAFLRTKAKDFDEAKVRANIEFVTKAETEVRKPMAVAATPEKAAEPTVTVKEGSTPTQVSLTPKILSNLTAQRGLPTDIFNAWAIGRSGFVKEQMNRTAHGIRELYRAIAKEYGIGPIGRMISGLTKVPPEQVRLFNSYLRGEVELTAIPETIRPSLANLRAHVDALSNTMIREGLTHDKLAAVIGDNLGMYLRRSYRVFDDPKWGINRLTTENQQRVISGMLQELRRENPKATVQDALNNIEAVLNEYRRTGEEGSFFGKGSTIGSKDLSLFFKRKDISDWWKTMMGEYETPVTNYVKTVSKMARFIADQRFLNAVEQAGVGKYLFEQPTTGHTARIAAEGSPSLSPLSKYYTTPEIARAFREFYDRPAAANPVWQLIMGVTYASKVAKTVGSFLTQARNLLSQPFFWLRNGHWDVREALPAIRSVYADVVGKEGAFLEYYRDAIRHGVANDTAQVGELRAVLKDVIGPRDFDVPVDLLAARSVAKTVRRAVVDPAERLYRTSDELGKLVGWEVEKFYLKKIRPDWSDAQIKNEAAIRVRNLYPTYSMISRFGKAAGKQPVVGPFISFPLEVIRTSYWAGKYSSIDLASTNPWQRLRGAKMLVGQLGTYAGLFAIASAVRQMFGVTKEQDEDLRRFMPEWSKNAQLLYLGPIENGRAEYVNLSYINPFSYMIDPMVAVAAFDADTYDERFWEAAKEFVRPFTSEQMTANAVVDLLRNQTESGRRIYNPEEDAPHKIKDVAKHIWEPVEPGTLTRLRRRIIPALRGEQPVTGQELSVTRELVSELTGIKAEGNDVETGISFKLRGFNRAEQDVENIWRSRLLSGGTFTPEAVASEYARMDGIRRRVWEELREDILAAKRLGISDEKVSGMLKSAGFSAETQNKILAGDYRPYSPSVDLLKKAIERGKEIPENTFGDDLESKLKLRQAKTELTGNARDILTAKNNVARFRRLKKAEEVVIQSTLTERDKQSRLAEIRRQIGLIQ